jgi:hypothetical protein
MVDTNGVEPRDQALLHTDERSLGTRSPFTLRLWPGRPAWRGAVGGEIILETFTEHASPNSMKEMGLNFITEKLFPLLHLSGCLNLSET